MERSATKRAEEAGIAVWLPLEERCTVRRGRRVVECNPVWPGYFFAQVQGPDCVRKINKTRGVLDLLCDEERQPAFVRDCTMQELRKLFGADGILRKDTFAIGQFVSAKSGAFVNLIGKFCGMENNREVAEFSLFGTECKVSFGQGGLVAV